MDTCMRKATIQNGVSKEIYDVEDTLRLVVKAGGNSGRVYLPVSWRGREVVVLLLKKV